MSRDPFPFMLGAFGVSMYVASTAPGLFFADSVELLVAAKTYGIPHSPSFPSYVTLARVIALIAGPHAAYALNLFSAIAAGVAVGVFCSVLLRAFSDERFGFSARVGAVVGALALAADVALWRQAVRTEVYALNLLTVVFLAHLVFPIASSRGELTGGERRRLALAGLVGGLGLASHSLLAGTAGVVFLVYLIALRREVLRPSVFFGASAFVLLGLTFYTVLPLRSIHNPALDYGHPATLPNFIEAVTRRGTAFVAPTVRADVGERAITFLRSFPEGVGAFFSVLAVIGVGAAVARRRRLLWPTLGLLIAGFLVSTRGTHFKLANVDAWGYMTIPHLGFAMLVGCGAWGAVRAVSAVNLRLGRRVLMVVAAGILIALAAVRMAVAARDESLAGFDAPRRLARAATASVPYEGCVVSDNAGTFFMLFYWTYAEGRRPDVDVVAASLALQDAYRGWIEGNRRLRATPMREIVRSITGGVGEVSARAARAEYLRALVDGTLAVRPVVLDQSREIWFDEARVVPGAFFTRAASSPEEAVFEPESLVVEAERTLLWCADAVPVRQRDLRVYLKGAANNAAAFCLRRGAAMAAEELSSLALRLSPDDAFALSGLAVSLVHQGRLAEAHGVLSAAVELYPDDKDVLLAVVDERLAWGDTATARVASGRIVELMRSSAEVTRASPAALGTIIVAVIAAFGLITGSFLNVVIWRVPRGESIIMPPSHCPSCGREIELWENVPVVSWIALRGRCRTCRAPISVRYPLVEAATGALFIALFLKFGLTWTFVAFVPFVAALIAVFAIDVDHLVIPDRLTLPFLVLGVLSSALGFGRGVVDSLTGVLVGGGGFYLIAVLGDRLFRRESMGGGDIKLMAAVGAYLGWRGAVMVTMIGAFLGTVVGLTAMLASRKVREEHVVPFGPFLVVAALVVIFFGDSLLAAYLRVFPVMAR